MWGMIKTSINSNLAEPLDSLFITLFRRSGLLPKGLAAEITASTVFNIKDYGLAIGDTIDVLIAGGGGQGGGSVFTSGASGPGAGGGGGFCHFIENFTLTQESYIITIGAGGTGDGGNTTAFGHSVMGGQEGVSGSNMVLMSRGGNGGGGGGGSGGWLGGAGADGGYGGTNGSSPSGDAQGQPGGVGGSGDITNHSSYFNRHDGYHYGNGGGGGGAVNRTQVTWHAQGGKGAGEGKYKGGNGADGRGASLVALPGENGGLTSGGGGASSQNFVGAGLIPGGLGGGGLVKIYGATIKAGGRP
ncbi:MAG: hypothetical protein FWE24_09250 [Defluviitaleaceae bacterium]|nr:hypothetical protein [Defluviitaleaceae bacterium]